MPNYANYTSPLKSVDIHKMRSKHICKNIRICSAEHRRAALDLFHRFRDLHHISVPYRLSRQPVGSHCPKSGLIRVVLGTTYPRIALCCNNMRCTMRSVNGVQKAHPHNLHSVYKGSSESTDSYFTTLPHSIRGRSWGCGSRG